MYQITKGESGFTVLEVVIAVLVLALGLMSAAVMQTRAVDESNAASRMTERVTASELFMEDLMGRTIVPSDPNLDPVFEDADGEWQDAPTPAECQPYQTQFRVVPNAPLNNLTTIQVVVTPQGMTETQRERKQITYSYVRSTRWN